MEPKLIDPRRRFFARSFDTLLGYALIISAVVLLCRVRPFVIISLIIPFIFFRSLLQIMVEPILIHKFGFTLGKWLMGLSISDWDDCYPTLEIAQRRTWSVMLRGQGLGIPVFEQIRSKKCFDSVKDGKTMDWEYETTQICDSPRRWKEVLAVILAVAMVVGTVLAVLSSDWVPNRGDLTKAEFCKNYNVVSRYYEATTVLQEDGILADMQGLPLAGATDTHAVFVEENGILKSVTMTVRNKDTLMSAQDSKLLFMTLAAVKSRVSPLSHVGEDMAQWMLEDPFSDCVTEAAGITVRRDWEINGFDIVRGSLRTDDPAATAVMTITVEFE
jgi:hypothetical protein